MCVCVEMWCRLLLSDREKRKQNSRRVMLSTSQLANFQENGSDLVWLSGWTLTLFWPLAVGCRLTVDTVFFFGRSEIRKLFVFVQHRYSPRDLDVYVLRRPKPSREFRFIFIFYY